MNMPLERTWRWSTTAAMCLVSVMVPSNPGWSAPLPLRSESREELPASMHPRRSAQNSFGHQQTPLGMRTVAEARPLAYGTSGLRLASLRPARKPCHAVRAAVGAGGASASGGNGAVSSASASNGNGQAGHLEVYHVGNATNIRWCVPWRHSGAEHLGLPLSIPDLGSCRAGLRTHCSPLAPPCSNSRQV